MLLLRRFRLVFRLLFSFFSRFPVLLALVSSLVISFVFVCFLPLCPLRSGDPFWIESSVDEGVMG